MTKAHHLGKCLWKSQLIKYPCATNVKDILNVFGGEEETATGCPKLTIHACTTNVMHIIIQLTGFYEESEILAKT